MRNNKSTTSKEALEPLSNLLKRCQMLLKGERGKASPPHGLRAALLDRIRDSAQQNFLTNLRGMLFFTRFKFQFKNQDSDEQQLENPAAFLADLCHPVLKNPPIIQAVPGEHTECCGEAGL